MLSQGEVRRGLVRLGGHGSMGLGVDRQGPAWQGGHVPVRRGRVWLGAVWHGKAVQGGQANKQVVGCSGPLHKHKKLFGGQYMSSFNKKTKQRIIDDYLQNTGANMFVPADFVDWLATQPEHEAYPAFYGMDDAEAARQHRIQMARQMASGLRIVAKTENVDGSVVAIKVTEYPAYISPVSKRREGGGYEPFDPTDANSQAELRRQAGTSLAAWLERFRGCAEHIGLDMNPLESIAHTLRDDKDRAVGE